MDDSCAPCVAAAWSLAAAKTLRRPRCCWIHGIWSDSLGFYWNFIGISWDFHGFYKDPIRNFNGIWRWNIGQSGGFGFWALTIYMHRWMMVSGWLVRHAIGFLTIRPWGYKWIQRINCDWLLILYRVLLRYRDDVAGLTMFHFHVAPRRWCK